MACTYLSECCHSPMIFMENQSTGILCCQSCKKICNALAAVSHCCLAEVIVPKESGVPFVCTLCEGACELGDPDTPTHEERIDGDILHILRQFGKGQINEKEAWNRLTDILESERLSCENMIAYGIKNEMWMNLSHPVPDSDPMMQGYMGGIDTSLTVLNKIVDNLLKMNQERE